MLFGIFLNFPDDGKGNVQIQSEDDPQLGRAWSSLAERVRISDDLHKLGKWCEKDNLWLGKTWMIGICESSREARVCFTGDFYGSVGQTFVKWHRCIWCCCWLEACRSSWGEMSILFTFKMKINISMRSTYLVKSPLGKDQHFPRAVWWELCRQAMSCAVMSINSGWSHTGLDLQEHIAYTNSPSISPETALSADICEVQRSVCCTELVPCKSHLGIIPNEES